MIIDRTDKVRVCDQCGCVQPEDDNPRAMRMPGERHYAGPCVPGSALSPEAEKKLREDLAEIARARREAWAKSRDYVIG